MESEFYIWRDSIDGNWFQFGVQVSGGSHVVECSMFTDAIYDLFGREFHESIKNIKPGIVVKVSCTMRIE